MLHVISGLQPVCIDKVESPQPIRVTYDIGRRGPLQAGSSGKALLAFVEPAELDHLLTRLEPCRHTELTMTDRDALRLDRGALEALRLGRAEGGARDQPPPRVPSARGGGAEQRGRMTSSAAGWRWHGVLWGGAG